MPFYILVSGVSRAGKSYFCDALSEARPQFTHVPLDKYIKPVPPGFSLSEWFFTPACIDWDLLQTHLDILQSGYMNKLDKARHHEQTHGEKPPSA